MTSAPASLSAVFFAAAETEIEAEAGHDPAEPIPHSLSQHPPRLPAHRGALLTRPAERGPAELRDKEKEDDDDDDDDDNCTPKEPSLLTLPLLPRSDATGGRSRDRVDGQVDSGVGAKYRQY